MEDKKIVITLDLKKVLMYISIVLGVILIIFIIVFLVNNRNEYRYLRIDITEVRNIGATMQMSEWCMYTKEHLPYIYPNNATIRASLRGNSEKEEITSLIDGNITTKYCTDEWSNNYSNLTKTGLCQIWIDLGKGNSVNLNDYPYYSYYTGNDREERDPVSWQIYGSNDGINYKLLDTRYKVIPSTERNTQCSLWTYEK